MSGSGAADGGGAFRRAGLLAAAFLAGASGLGLEVLLLSLAGLSVGYGRAAPLGIAVFIAGWALGAAWAGRWSGRASRALAGAGLAVAVGSLVLPQLLLWTAAHGTWPLVSAAVAGLSILAVALPQGTLLPLLARSWRAGARAGLAALIGANLLGASAGAWWFGERVPAADGRTWAAMLAGAVALAAGIVGARAARGHEPERVEPPPPSRDACVPALELPLAGLLLALLTGWVATGEWLALRLGVLWLGGMQQALSAVLVASLLALSLGAALGPPLLRRGVGAVLTLFVACTVLSLWPFVAHRAMGALPRDLPDLVRALVLVGPALAPFGAAVPVLHRELERPDGAALGRLLGYEAFGALVGIPLSHFVLLPAFGLKGTLAAWCLVGALGMLLLVPRLRLRAALGVAGALIAFTLAASRLAPAPALESPPLTNPALSILAFEEDEHFAVSVVEDGVLGERTLMTDGFRAAGTGETYRYMRALGHVPLLLHPAPKRVAVLAFGTGTTAGAVSLHPVVEHIDVLELSEAVLDHADWFEEVNRGVLGDPRVRTLVGDGRRTLAGRDGAYDVLTMEPLLPNSPFGVYLYTQEFYERARRALAPGGILCQWVPPHAVDTPVLQAVRWAFERAFPWSGVWLFGTQLVLVGAEAQPELVDARFDATGELGAELEALGLGSRAGLTARFLYQVVGSGSYPGRDLTDEDPWIVYRPLPEGAAKLGLLAENLSALRGSSGSPPPSWTLGFGAEELALLEGIAALRRAREAAEVERARLFGIEIDPGERLGDLAEELAEALRLAGDDPGVQAFAREITRERARREGLTALAADRGPAGGRAALDPLLEAAELAPERADAHLYVAVALERMGQLPAAQAALARALEHCPRLAETRAGDQARALGFPATSELARGGF